MALLVISALCLAIYSNSLDVPFHFDDEKNITEVESIRLTDLSMKTVFDAGFNGRLSSRPLANISFALNYYFTGFDVSYFHIINILIHLINGGLVYLLSLSILKRFTTKQTSVDVGSNNLILFFAALFSACFFIAHPLQTQSVTYIVQKMNSLAVLFYLLSINLYIIGRSIEKQSHRLIIFAGCVASWLLSLASKEIAVFLPLIIFLYEWYFFQNTNREWIRKRIPSIVLIFFIMATIVMIYTDFHPISRILVDYQGRGFSLLERLMTQPRVVVFYLSLLILPLPSRLNLLHEFPISHSLLDPATTMFSLILLIAILAFAIVKIKKHRIISFCILWFFIHLLIESSVVALEMVFEHRMYLPMVGISIAMGYLFMKFLNIKKTLVVVIALVFLAVFSLSAHIRNEDWRTSESLWTDVISKNPNSHRGYYNLGTVYLDKG
jgi:protein O-mannosyl-transferase